MKGLRGICVGMVLGVVAAGVLMAGGSTEEDMPTFKTPCEIDVEMESAKSVAGDCCGDDEWRSRFYYNPIRVHFSEMKVDIELTAEVRERDPSRDDIGRKTKTISMSCTPNEVETRAVTIDAIACEDGPRCGSRTDTETWRFEFAVTAEGPATEDALVK